MHNERETLNENSYMLDPNGKAKQKQAKDKFQENDWRVIKIIQIQWWYCHGQEGIEKHPKQYFSPLVNSLCSGNS